MNDFVKVGSNEYESCYQCPHKRVAANDEPCLSCDKRNISNGCTVHAIVTEHEICYNMRRIHCKIIKTTKEHKCAGCGCIITKGSHAQQSTYHNDKKFLVIRLCSRCVEVEDIYGLKYSELPEPQHQIASGFIDRFLLEISK